jgi:hypothetical protein
MKLKRASRIHWPRTVQHGPVRNRVLILGLGGAMGAICAGVLLLGLGGSVGCDTYPTNKSLPLNCSVADDYDFDLLADFEDGDKHFWGPSGDTLCNPAAPDAGVAGGKDASLSMAVEPINDSDAGRCGSTKSLVIRSAGCNDWGSLAGFNSLGSPPKDESAREGVSFWARAPGNTSKSFSLLLDDINTATEDPSTVDISIRAPSNCLGADGGTGQQTATIRDTSGNVISGNSTGQPLPFQCGNSYHAGVVVTSDWQFYTIPWHAFTQDAKPNRVPNALLTETGPVPGTGLLTSKLRYLVIRFPKEADAELWIDNLGFYSKKKGQ